MREGHELNVDPVPVGLAHPQHGFEIGEADVVVDVDVAARPRRAVGDQGSDERRGARLDRQRDAMAFDSLRGDPLAHAVSLEMGQTRRAPMRLVEMDVAVDERRQEERALKIDALAWLISASGRMQRRNQAVRRFRHRRGRLEGDARWPGSSDEAQALRRRILIQAIAIVLEFFAGRESQTQIMLVIARDSLAINLGPVG